MVWNEWYTRICYQLICEKSLIYLIAFATELQLFIFAGFYPILFYIIAGRI